MPRKPKFTRVDFYDAQPFKIDGVYCKLIQLTARLYAIVNASDHKWLSRWVWGARLHHSGNKYYAVRTHHITGGRRGRKTSIQMHAAIRGKGSDHRNMCSLDNRRKNLRPASRSQNGANCRPRSGRRFKGVYRRPNRPYIESAITVSGKTLFLGHHTSEELAARAYDAAARRYFGEFARTNFP